MKRNSFLGIALLLVVAVALVVFVGKENARSDNQCTFWGVVYDDNTGEPLSDVAVHLVLGETYTMTQTRSEEGHEGEYAIGPPQGTGEFCLWSSIRADTLRDAYEGIKTDPDAEYHDLYLDELGGLCTQTK